jgi:hypothetical protein
MPNPEKPNLGMTRPELAPPRVTPSPANPPSASPVRTSRAVERPAPEPPPQKHRASASLGWSLAAIVLLLAGSALGSSYYLASPGERVRDSLHIWLRPSGYIGQTAGILALGIFLFLWLYPLRKRFRWLQWTGSMSSWLSVHVSLALTLPVIGAIHAAWKFDGIIGLGYWSMLVVWMSGIVGRYLYVHIPRGATGLELTAEEIAAERRELLARVAGTCGLPVAQVDTLLRSDPTPLEGFGFMKTLIHMVRDDLARRRAARALRRICRNRPAGRRLDSRMLREVVRLANREMALTQQARILESTRRVFRFWHVAHRPFALVALLAVLVHVGVVVAMGATWFW